MDTAAVGLKPRECSSCSNYNKETGICSYLVKWVEGDWFCREYK